MPTGTKLNGVTHSWQTIESTIAGLNFENIKSLNYKDSLDPGKRRSRSGKVTAFTHGDYDAEGDLELPKEDSDELIQTLAGLRSSGDGFGLVAFDIIVNYSDGGDSPVLTDTLVGCRITENDSSNAQGNEDSMVKHTLLIGEIFWNGKRLSDIGNAG